MGNRIQSCALSGLQDSNAQVEFVNCFMVLFKKGHLNEEYGQTVSLNIFTNFTNRQTSHNYVFNF